MDNQSMLKGLSEIDHYIRFPAMVPFLGDYYVSNDHGRLLIIGESYYLPNETTLHHSPKIWYQSTQSELEKEEIEWINCSGLLKCDWGSAGHFIYRELNSCIALALHNGKNRAMENVAFTNYFQRPAEEEGESFKRFCVSEDLAHSIDIAKRVIDIICPDLIIFVSKYAWDVGGSLVKNHAKTAVVDFVCHPGTGGRYWHNNDYPHNREKFLKLLREHFT